MTGQAIVGVNKYTNEITPISKVIKTGLGCDCICHSCEKPLEAVLNTTRKKHFRHSNKNNCQPTLESELHLLAKYIIFNNSQLYVPEMGMVKYTNPLIEVRFDDLVPDATITIDDQIFHVEIVVTNPINAIKLGKYRTNRSRVLIIDLSEEDRNLDFDSLEELVINETGNRYMLSYSIPITQQSKPVDDSYWKWLLGAGVVSYLIWKKFFKADGQTPGHRRKKNY